MGSAAPRAELGRACCPILIPRGGPGHGGLIRVLPTGSFPQDGTCDLGERCTAGDRYELLGSDGMWTKRGPAKPARGAATLRLADLCLARQTPPAAPDKRAPPGNRLVRGSPGGSGPGSSPCIGGLSPVTGMVVAQPLVQTMRLRWLAWTTSARHHRHRLRLPATRRRRQAGQGHPRPAARLVETVDRSWDRLTGAWDWVGWVCSVSSAQRSRASASSPAQDGRSISQQSRSPLSTSPAVIDGS
jgi:hypothetical protein